ncbi:hypothetical protein [Actinomadura sp. 3N508]|uniref:hypothetical protein n=1 Tax=Actinomadura sp. 3N508 TaxID=3375153 RepID=UPI0037AF9985
MDVVAGWTMKIATRVTPNEADFATEVGEAYAAGGRARAGLFPRPGAEPGGFALTALIGELPVILRALADSAESLRQLLGSRELRNAVAIVSLAVAARGQKSGDRKTDAGNDPDTKGDGDGIRPEEKSISGDSGAGAVAVEAARETASAPEAVLLESAHRQLRERLARDGMPQLRAELVAYELLDELLSAPDGAEEFLRELTSEPEE